LLDKCFEDCGDQEPRRAIDLRKNKEESAQAVLAIRTPNLTVTSVRRANDYIVRNAKNLFAAMLSVVS